MHHHSMVVNASMTRRFCITSRQAACITGRELCEDCGAFLRWVERPGNTEAQKLRAARIARLAMVETLSEWERGFIKSVAKFKKHSPRQIAVIDRMTKDYLKGA
jgi:hypothetical protein